MDGDWWFNAAGWKIAMASSSRKSTTRLSCASILATCTCLHLLHLRMHSYDENFIYSDRWYHTRMHRWYSHRSRIRMSFGTERSRRWRTLISCGKFDNASICMNQLQIESGKTRRRWNGLQPTTELMRWHIAPWCGSWEKEKEGEGVCPGAGVSRIVWSGRDVMFWPIRTL